MIDLPPLVNVKGNLRRKLEFLKRIGKSKFILNVTERGYMLPFLSFPEPAAFRTNRSSLAHAEFVEDAIRELVESGRVILKLSSLRSLSIPCHFPFQPQAKRG